MNRRNFLNKVAGGLVGLNKSIPDSLSYLSFAQEDAKADILVIVFQRGGMDGLSAVVPYAEGANYYDRRPTIAIPEPGKESNTAIDLDGKFGLHPSLAALQDIYNEGDLAFVHAAGSPDPSRSHFDAQNYMESGTPGNKLSPSGWLNRYLQSKNNNSSPFRAIGIGSMVQGSLRGEVPALAMQSISGFHLAGNREQVMTFQRALAQLYRVPEPRGLLEHSAKETLKTLSYLQRLASEDYSPAAGVEYPSSSFGRGLRQIAQLIKEDVGLEVACVDIGGWDTHNQQGSSSGTISNLLSDFGNGLAAFYADTQEQMKNISLITMSEFGRRASENASEGTDHGHGNVMFAMGGGVNSAVHTRWPGLASDSLDRGDLAVTTDYRDVLAEVLIKRQGVTNIDKIFAGYKPQFLNIVTEKS